MRREPPVTLRGALKILGHHNRPLLDRLNALLGGAILVGGTAAMATGGLPALAAGGILAAVWGWVDQKNEAAGLLRSCLDGISDRLSSTRGYERHQLIAAAHTAIVVSAYFEVLREQLGRAAYRELALRDHTKVAMATAEWQSAGDTIVARLYEAAVPAPSATLGFEENSGQVQTFLEALNANVHRFRNDFIPFAADSAAWPEGDLVEFAVERYRSHFLTLAATVPEFMIWANLGEHAATRAAVAGTREEFTAALGEHGRALNRVESLLRLCAPPGSATGGPLETLRRANRAVLDAPVIDADTARLDSGITFPEIGRSYVDPRYRLTRFAAGVRAADESQWAEYKVRDDVDLLVAGHVVSPEATRLPLLLLGHPGAGKSLLTKVLAARLPSTSFTVVRVPLRRVGANAPVYRQIQEALDLVTHERVSWSDLAEQSAETVRVVLLDGLDELLQATANDRTGYLREVAEFQRAEAIQDRPVIVVVTSRTVVADRVDIPTGTPIVRLEAFDDDQIRAWVVGWHEANAGQIRAGRVRGIPVNTALDLRHLARQPVLLLMLALYLADPDAPDLDSGLSEAGLLRQLLREFAIREVRKHASGRLVGDVLEGKVDEQLRRLSVAALGMFNRGRQDISEEELGADLNGLGVPMPEGLRPDELGQRVLGEFFFLHTAEATVPTEAAPGRVRRRYEFLHATFGEYLVAAHVVDTLADVADGAFGGRRAREPQDDLLFALLSHQPLAIQRPLLTFVRQLVAELSDAERHAMARTVETLIRGHRQRHGSTLHAGYRPAGPDQLRQLASYSANLVLLRLALTSTVALTDLWPEDAEPLTPWRSTVNLWRAGLDASGWRAMLIVVHLNDGTLSTVDSRGTVSELDDVRYALMLGDAALTTRTRIGTSVRDGVFFDPIEGDDRSWVDAMLNAIAAYVLSADTSQILALTAGYTAPVPDFDLAVVTELLCWAARIRVWEYDEATVLLTWLLDHGDRVSIDPTSLALLVGEYPAVLAVVPALQDPDLYGESPGDHLIFVLGQIGEQSSVPELDTLVERLALAHGAVDTSVDTTLTSALELVRELLKPHPNVGRVLRWDER